MLSFPNCKINIGLHITAKRADGYHDLETIFFPVNIKDSVEIVENDSTANDIIFSSSGNSLDVTDENNICVKAYRLLKKDFPQIPAVKMHLHKNIPSGAGLGGGSADATAVLTLLDRKFSLDIPAEKMMQYALLLGSDCPFFILNKPALAKGRGEILHEIPLDLSAYQIMIVNPGIHINTATAFAAIDAGSFSPAGKLEADIQKGISQWKGTIENDFEKNAFLLYPQLAEIKQKMYDNGAGFSAMSGSGSSIYGIFPKNMKVDIKFPADWFCQTV
jgi:4-diphosphocytidyl-2-C-methyl-D-erythritol kinase